MLNDRQSSVQKAIALVALALVLLGGLLIGLHSGGWRLPFLAGPAAHSSAPSTSAAARASGDLARPDKEDDEAEDEDEEWSFHDRLTKFFRDGDESALDGLAPLGITDIEGAGGKGLNRQVKSHGVWYPIFDLSQARNASGDLDPDDRSPGMLEKIKLAKIPLAIASANPPPGVVGQPFSYTFAAIGGTPPYRWSAQLGAGAQFFVFDPFSGLLSGRSDSPLSTAMNVFVTDAASGQASAVFSLVISPTTPLVITTDSLPLLEIGKPYQAGLQGEGGVPPYTWAISGSAPSLVCDPATGLISGTVQDAGSLAIVAILTDSQQTTVEKTLAIQASAGLSITTESPLLPATPGADYSLTFEATGGTAPYTWRVVGGSLPSGWQLQPEGVLTGRADQREGLFHFDIQVTDSNSLTYRQSFDLAVMQPLTVIPSRNKAGIAWQPKVMARVLSAPLATVTVTRTASGGVPVEVYRGNGTSFVDRDLATGMSYDYQLTAHTTDAHDVNFGKTRIKILPMALTRAVPGITADPYADRVRAFNPLAPYGYGAGAVPLNVTGPPDGQGTFFPAYLPTQVVSLHARTGVVGGSITLEFTDNIIELGNGLDFTVFENVLFKNGDPNQRYMEPATVEVALFDGEWYRFPINVNPPAKGKPDLTRPTYYIQGFAGINGTTGDDPTNASRSGGDSFDINNLAVSGLTWVRFVRIQSTGDNALSDINGAPVLHTAENNALSGTAASGFDLDAVSAVNY